MNTTSLTNPDPNVTQYGISSWVDGVKDLLFQAGQGWIREQFPERNMPVDTVTTSLQDTAVNEAKVTQPDMTSTYVRYAAIGGAVLVGVAALVWAVRS